VNGQFIRFSKYLDDDHLGEFFLALSYQLAAESGGGPPHSMTLARLPRSGERWSIANPQSAIRNPQ
jgi:hypothetical protein